MASAAFVDSLHEVFQGLGRIQTRRMFGGHGVFHDGRMIALVLGDVLYLKADDQSAPHFDALQLPHFSYMRQGKPARLSYREAPADLFDDAELATLWGRRAWEAALRAGAPKPAKPAKPPAKKTKKAP
jgi:DNA transformation protein